MQSTTYNDWPTPHLPAPRIEELEDGGWALWIANTLWVYGPDEHDALLDAYNRYEDFSQTPTDRVKTLAD